MAGMTDAPVDSVTVCREACWRMFSSVTCAPGIVAPLGSATTPLRVAVPNWARRFAQQPKNPASATKFAKAILIRGRVPDIAHLPVRHFAAVEERSLMGHVIRP